MNGIEVLLIGQGINLITVVCVVYALGYWNKVSRQNLKDDLRSTVAEMIQEINRIPKR